MTTKLYPLRFRPLLQRYLWGGRRLGQILGKPIGPESDYAESWEICDHKALQSTVAFGPLKDATLRQLMLEHGPELLGRHHPLTRFPLLLKYLDAAKTLSVQVHPDDARAAKLAPPDLGKTEAWVVLEAASDSLIYSGLRPGVTAQELARAVREGNCQDCLNTWHPTAGDCVFLPAGAVHALGAGILVAEIQQTSDTTYRLFDWNRLAVNGKPRPLHIAEALESIDYRLGPIGPQIPRPTSHPAITRLVACDKFILDRRQFDSPQTLAIENRFRILTVLAGSLTIEGDPSPTPLKRGDSVLIPASEDTVELNTSTAATLLEAYLPEHYGKLAPI